MAKKTPEKPHTPSAYDEFLRSGEFDTIESDIDYLVQSRSNPNPSEPRKRSLALPACAQAAKKPLNALPCRRKRYAKQSLRANQSAAAKRQLQAAVNSRRSTLP